MIRWIKLLRNQMVLRYFLRQKSIGLSNFMLQAEVLNKNVLFVVIAYEQPWAIKWLTNFAALNLPPNSLMVVDNSRDNQLRLEIEKICMEAGVPYLGLPWNPTSHANRSHGLAMTWVYHRVIKRVAPKIFGFIDHDLIPIQKFSIDNRFLDVNSCYGVKNQGIQGYWSLWAGYCFYRLDAVSGLNLNFLNNFDYGLDTGGRNWEILYSKINQKPIDFASREIRSVVGPEGTMVGIELIDHCWVHVGGISYNDNLLKKKDFFDWYFQELKNAIQKIL